MANSFCVYVYGFPFSFITFYLQPSNTDKAGDQSGAHLRRKALALLRQAERDVKEEGEQHIEGRAYLRG